MEELKQQVIRKAQMLGLSDIRFTVAEGTLSHAGGKPVALQDVMPGARSLIVLFAAYRPVKPAPPGHMAVSPYYPASHRAYTAARALTGFLRSRSVQALHATSLPAKAAALRTGGVIGDNGFFFHPRFGSLVCIQTLLTDAPFSPDEPERGCGCLHCGRCAKACPSGAVGKIDRCLRRHLSGLVPEPLRGDVYQLLGCEKCQTACPYNRFEPEEPVSFPLEALLSGSALPQLKQLVGPNMARLMRVKAQAALYAANTGYKESLPELSKLMSSGADPAAAHAAWALSRLKSEDTP
ncbi:MAG: epoxyqueuosine reductase [Christensenellaceae bacterium]|nr:epoxyqueuosine reductase [Christensenellaceae bacterium]